MSPNAFNVLITGDIVLDCHLYGGVKAGITSPNEPGSSFTERLGGAVLTEELITAASNAFLIKREKARKDWEQKNQQRTGRGEPHLPLPVMAAPIKDIHLHLGLEKELLEKSLPDHLRSYGVWTERPIKKSSREKVWRVDRHFGYGPSKNQTKLPTLARNKNLPPDNADLTVIDDGAIFFRHTDAKNVWPEFSKNDTGYYLLKMSEPLCRGDLWSSLSPVMARLIVVVSADDLRMEDVQISRCLSWEQSVEQTIKMLKEDSIGRELLRPAEGHHQLWVGGSLVGQQ